MDGSRFAHIFFDLDGTLVDPRDGIVGSIQYALQALGEPARDPSLLTRFIGPPLAGTFRTLLGTDDPGRVRQAIAAYRVRFARDGHPSERASMTGSATHCVRSATWALPLRVVTSKPGDYAETDRRRAWAAILLRGRARLRRSTASERRRAHSSGTFSKLNAWRPGTVVMVGDRAHDVIGARENGVACVAVRWGFGSREELDAAETGRDRRTRWRSSLRSSGGPGGRCRVFAGR